VLCSAALAATAKPPSLKVTVPATVHPGQQYKITITGTYDKSSLHTTPYLVAFLQYTSSVCKSTARAEYSLPATSWSWDFYPAQSEPSSPFTRIDHWTAHKRLGTRRVCAYLYPKKISAKTTTVKPLVTATASFRNK
jgi:hypothetical protein